MSGPAGGFGYYPSLTGLRGVAIALVVAFHLGLPLPGGGVVGVTLFFVLSGFLITSLIVAEITRTGHLDLVAFYVRRARRLLPPLFTIVGLFALLEAASGTLASTAGNDVLALSYVSNWARAAGDPMGLWNHTWSLAIEEQFYLVWPMVFLVALRLGCGRSRGLVAVVAGAALASALLRLVLVANGIGSDRIYFGSDTRAEAILLGSAVALVRHHGRAWIVPDWLGVVGFAGLMAASVVGSNSIDLWPAASYSIIAMTACAAVLGGLGRNHLAGALASRPLTWLGDRSYSLYLWHVPVIMVSASLLPQAPLLPRAAVVLAVSLALSSVSYLMVERRFRARRSGAPQVRVLPKLAAARPEVAA